MRVSFGDTLAAVSGEVMSRTDLPNGLQTLYIKILALIPIAYEAGFKDGENERMGGEAEIDAILKSRGVSCNH